MYYCRARVTKRSSYDNKKWKRLKNTKYSSSNKSLTWKINPKKSTLWFAYYPPYPFSKSKKLLSNMKTIGYSNDKNPILMKKLLLVIDDLERAQYLIQP